jgi:hypothetical protein
METPLKGSNCWSAQKLFGNAALDSKFTFHPVGLSCLPCFCDMMDWIGNTIYRACAIGAVLWAGIGVAIMFQEHSGKKIHTLAVFFVTAVFL